MAGEHHRLSGHESKQTPGDNEGWGAWRTAIHRVKSVGHALRDLKTPPTKRETGLHTLTSVFSASVSSHVHV